MLEKSNEYNSQKLVQNMLVFALLIVIFNVIYKKFGTYSFFSSGRYSNMEMLGIVTPLFLLILPIFKKEHRKEFWSKRNLILIFTILLISTVLIAIIYANKYYYRSYWFDIGLLNRERSLAPPIRWDIWNIINKQYPE